MTNEEAIELLNRIAPMPRRGDGKSITQSLVMEAIVRAILALEQTRWIPVSERLPEEYKRVLVSDLWNGVYVGQYVDAEENWGGEHFINEAGMHSKTVIAWMPLPHPYEEVEE